MSRKINVCNGKSRSVPASAGINGFVHKIVSEWYRVHKRSREVLFKSTADTLAITGIFEKGNNREKN